MTKPIAITMGDPAGIGPEIIAKLVSDPGRASTPLVVVGDEGAMARALSAAGRPADAVRVLQAGAALPAHLPVGHIDALCGAAAFTFINRAIDLALAGAFRALVTAPISKEAMRLAGIAYPGHTEILANRCRVADFAMMLVNDELRVLLVSIHLSLSDAIAAITTEAELRAICLADQACRAFGVAAPRVAVAGLNPHAGENGLFGSEDSAIIAPAIAVARQKGVDASGPWPPDTIFMRARRGEFDIVVAQYHDQGLIPVKYLGIDKGVNITVGLPFVRTSVDHGTAFDIAGKGVADPSSLAEAVRLALLMTAEG